MPVRVSTVTPVPEGSSTVLLSVDQSVAAAPLSRGVDSYPHGCVYGVMRIQSTTSGLPVWKLLMPGRIDAVMPCGWVVIRTPSTQNDTVVALQSMR